MKKVVFWGLILSVLSCKVQQKPSSFSNKEPIKMAKLDNKSFDEIQVNGEANFTLPNGNSVRQIRMRDIYVEDIKIKGTPFKTQNIYARSNGAIQSSVEVFYGFPIGAKKVYDGNGNVIKEMDLGLPTFEFSIYNLAEKIKNEFNIDIMKENITVNVSRTLVKHDSVPIKYNVSLPANPNLLYLYSADRRMLLIDGHTGKILSNTIVRYSE